MTKDREKIEKYLDEVIFYLDNTPYMTWCDWTVGIRKWRALSLPPHLSYPYYPYPEKRVECSLVLCSQTIKDIHNFITAIPLRAKFATCKEIIGEFNINDVWFQPDHINNIVVLVCSNKRRGY